MTLFLRSLYTYNNIHYKASCFMAWFTAVYHFFLSAVFLFQQTTLNLFLFKFIPPSILWIFSFLPSLKQYSILSHPHYIHPIQQIFLYISSYAYFFLSLRSWFVRCFSSTFLAPKLFSPDTSITLTSIFVSLRIQVSLANITMV